MKNGSGNRAAALAEVDSITFAANDFALTDMCLVEISEQGNGGATKIELVLDGTTIISQVALRLTGTAKVWNDDCNANKLTFMSEYLYDANAAHNLYNNYNCGSHAITGAWKLALNAGVAGNTTYWRWNVYKLKGS